MRKITTTFVLMISLLANVQENKDFINESQDEFNARIEWVGKAKYGMLICFGLSAQLGGVWKGEQIEEGYAEWIQASADITPQEYAMLTHTFSPKDFDANFIVETAKKAGNLLLNIGPDGNGKVPEESIKILLDVG
ncbi:alpha-L-fucosidase [Polaribacter sp. HL-MS24]|uniref:alpha-L-fucosidase n=1 Tax=Polaribacter sp. HL-MS24 TaxID=3077735 RepID=UPI00293485FD|nr:alpha-L-fucosidase [Polaribacter sp. HL-MS24]WOC40876.1 alpha-L-fucosidase [Polaribacter sp. HL-MS24]